MVYGKNQLIFISVRLEQILHHDVVQCIKVEIELVGGGSDRKSDQNPTDRSPKTGQDRVSGVPLAPWPLYRVRAVQDCGSPFSD